MKRLLLLLIPLFALCMLCGCSEQTDSAFKYYSYRSKEVFSSITLSAAVRGGAEEAALDEMYALMREIDSEISLTKEDSALSRFNRSAVGERTEISHTAYEMIIKSIEYSVRTDGLFDISVYPLVKLWGVDANESGADEGYLPTQDEIAAAKESCGMVNLELTELGGKYFIAKKRADFQIDLGAIAKGYAADRCIEIAKSHGAESALINLSGNISVLGSWYHPEHKKYERWIVGLTSPRPRGGVFGNVCAVSVSGGKTFVTSGDYARYRKAETEDGDLYIPHIVNARTGLPLGVEMRDGKYANTTEHIISATVICENSARADAYATAVCLMDKDAAVSFMRREKLHGIIITEDGYMYLVGVTESDESGEEYFVLKSGDGAVNGYEKYSIEEFDI